MRIILCSAGTVVQSLGIRSSLTRHRIFSHMSHVSGVLSSSSYGLVVNSRNVPNRSLLKQRKMDNYSKYYIRHNREWICLRSYCISCLKISYLTKLDSLSGKKNWICPFCAGMCFCVRCFRNDHVNRKKNLLLRLGDDLVDKRVEKYARIMKRVTNIKLKDY